MKRIFSIALLILYSSLTVISAVSLHYCHGKLIDFSITHTAESCCNTMSEKSICCKDIVIEVELDENQLAETPLVLESIKSQTLILAFESELFATTIFSQSQSVKIEGSPPGESVMDIFLLNESFLFYG